MESIAAHNTLRQVTTLRLTPSRIVSGLGAIACTLTLISLGTQLVRYVGGHDHVYGLLPIAERIFHLNEETNIPTLFSTFLHLIAAASLLVLARLKSHQGDRDSLRWIMLSIGFVYLAIDEAWSLHEMFNEPMRHVLRNGDRGLFHFSWVIPALAAVFFLSMFFFRFFLRLPSATQIQFLAAAALFLGGAIGMEMLAGKHIERYGPDNLMHQLMIHVEESMEMAGIIVFIYALLRYMEEHYHDITVLVGDSLPRESSPGLGSAQQDDVAA